MTSPGGNDPHASSARVGRAEPPPSGTATGADTTARMSGTQQVVRPTGEHRDRDLSSFKTSAAAVFALVFGLAALFCALTAILAPAAVLFGIIGIVLGIVGLKMAKRPNVTGKGVAIGGLVTAVLGLLLGGAVLAGVAAVVNDEQMLDQLQTRLDNLRGELPSTAEIRQELPS
jgi:hypothetical protein